MSEVYASKNESGCDVPKVLKGCVSRGIIRVEVVPFSSTGYMRTYKELVHNEINSYARYYPELSLIRDTSHAVEDRWRYWLAGLRPTAPMLGHSS